MERLCSRNLAVSPPVLWENTWFFSLKLVHLFQDSIVHWLIIKNTSLHIPCTLAEESFCSLLTTGQRWEYQNEVGSTLQPEWPFLFLAVINPPQTTLIFTDTSPPSAAEQLNQPWQLDPHYISPSKEGLSSNSIVLLFREMIIYFSLIS